MTLRIPKRIIQTGKHLEQPLRSKAMMANLRLLNPDFEYLFFDDARVQSFIDKEFPQFHAVFDSFQFSIQKYDFFRYLAVYHYGGFYFDLDVMLATGLSSLLEYGCVFTFEGLTISRYLRTHYSMDWEIGNYAFGAAPGHPFLRALIDNCVKAQQDPAWVKPMLRGIPALSRTDYQVLNTSGPGLVSRTLAEDSERGKLVTVLFPDDVIDTSKWNRFGDLGVHLMQGSWRPSRSYLRNRLAHRLEAAQLRGLLKDSVKLGKTRSHGASKSLEPKWKTPHTGAASEPLVSVLIPAFNAERCIAGTIRSAIAQTWKAKEIIVVDDGSTDRTLEIARQFESESVRVVTQAQQGAAAARNKAFSLSRGEYIQWLDADDLLSNEKIALQMKVAQELGSKRVLLSSGFGSFICRDQKARFVPSALWADLSPTEWLFHKLDKNVFLQTACWLVSRELSEAAGRWDSRLLADDDGEYFARVILASEGVKFVPGSKVYYRGPALAFRSLSYIGESDRQIKALWLAMQLHMGYLRSLEDSERTRSACLAFMRTSLLYFYPERRDLLAAAEDMARELGGSLGVPKLSWKYEWIRRLFGWRVAKTGQRVLLNFRWIGVKLWDQVLFGIERRTGTIKKWSLQILRRLRGRYQRFVAGNLYRRTFTIKSSTPIISFTFDDCPRSALLKGGKILRSMGVSGTYYVSLGLAGKQTETGGMFEVEDLRAALEQGHELGCHTFNHSHSWETEPQLFELQIIENQRALQQVIPEASFRSLSFPIGHPRAETKRRASKHFSCCRGGGQTFNVGEADLNCLAAYFLEQSVHDPEAVKRMIDRNAKAGGWLIFATHDVCENPTQWGCTPEFFENVVQYAVDSGAQILPVIQAYEALSKRNQAVPTNVRSPKESEAAQ
jgi:glycosyltransferase involved in cell wall biosynthesis